MAKSTDDKKYTRDIEQRFIEQLKEGAFKEFLAYVKEHEEELALCFRGNDQKVSIYRDNHIVWDLYDTSWQNKVEISFDHARFCEDWESGVLAGLETCGFKSTRKEEGRELITCAGPNKKNSYSFGAGSVCRVERDKTKIFEKETCVEESYAIIRKMHDTYRDTLSSSYEGVRTNHFVRYYLERHPERKEELGKYLVSSPDDLLEKKVQQNVFIHNHNTDDGVFVYDMEFAQPRIDKWKMNNKPDMLGIRYENGEPQAIVLIEIKCTRSACPGTSGVKEHLDEMKEYIDEAADINKKDPARQQLVRKVKEHRREEAVKILKAYEELGLRHLEKGKNYDKISTLPFELMFLFTHEGCTLFKENSNGIRNLFPESEYHVYDSEKDCNIPVRLDMDVPYTVIISGKYR